MNGAWMHDRERELIEKYLTPDSVMFEWGSGGSTQHFSKLVKRIYSIENNKEWYSKVSETLQEVDNATLYYIPGEPSSTFYHQSTYEDYREYIDAIEVPNEQFDLILVDGRARRLCAYKALEYLKQDGVLVIHDWCERPPYWCVQDYYDVLEKIDDTPQTIAIFKPKVNWRDIKGYDLNLETFERIEG